MNLNQLRCAVAVADHGSFTRAAASLHLSQPSLSYAISKLESELGKPIFLRLPRQITLTAAGQAFLGPARLALDHADRARAVVGEIGSEVTGTLRVAHIRTTTAQVGKAIGVLRRRFPAVAFYIREPTDDAGVAHLVRTAQSDLGIMRASYVTSDLVSVDVGLERWFAAFPAGHAPGGEAVRIEDLTAHSLIAPPAGTRLRASFDELFARVQIKPDIAAEADDTHMLLTLVRSGVGAALVPDTLIGETPDAEVDLRVLAPAIAHSLAVVHRSDAVTPAIEAFRNVAVEQMGSSAAPACAPS